jgi:oligogalacturonide lyase
MNGWQLKRWLVLIVCLTLWAGSGAAAGADGAGEAPKRYPFDRPTPPVEWVDPTTGHKVIRLSRQPGRNTKFYFHQNAFTSDGRMLYSNFGADRKHRLFLVDLKTFEEKLVVEGGTRGGIVGRKTDQFYYAVDGEVRSTNLRTGQTRVITKLPAEWMYGSHFALNADETLLAGSYSEGMAEVQKSKPRREWFNAIFDAKLKAHLYVIDIATGNRRVIHSERAWVSHVQFSPTDPQQLMFCHEGPWDKVDRIWTVRTDGTGLKKVHERTMVGEIAGHEFWGPDGRMIWFDLQQPRSTTFYLAGQDLTTGRTVRYPLERDQWSLHYTVSDDGELFAGDGGSPAQVARAKDGKWIWLFEPHDSTVKARRLCSIAEHDYRLEPNVNFTPDSRMVVFQAQLHGGHAQVYGVVIEK